jgi:hypothetical protein
MKILVCILLLLLPTLSFAQPNNKNYLSFGLDVAPNFTLNSTSLLESPQTISNSFHLTVRTERNNASVYASIPSDITTSTSTAMSAGNIKLNLNHTDCPAANQSSVNNNDIPMSTSNTLLFKQIKKGGLIADWYYDVIIPALGYNYAPGDYDFTFLFTLTQP